MNKKVVGFYTHENFLLNYIPASRSCDSIFLVHLDPRKTELKT